MEAQSNEGNPLNETVEILGNESYKIDYQQIPTKADELFAKEGVFIFDGKEVFLEQYEQEYMASGEVDVKVTDMVLASDGESVIAKKIDFHEGRGGADQSKGADYSFYNEIGIPVLNIIYTEDPDQNVKDGGYDEDILFDFMGNTSDFDWYDDKYMQVSREEKAILEKFSLI